MNIKVVTPPAVEPVSLAEAKAHLRVDGEDDDLAIQLMIEAAREQAEAFTRRTFITTTYQLALDASPEPWLVLPRPPLAEVVKVEVVSDAGTVTEVSPSIYATDLLGERLFLKSGQSWPVHRDLAGFLVTYRAGYGATAADVPAKVRQAILMAVATMYEYRQDVIPGTNGSAQVQVELPTGSKALLAGLRVLSL